MVYLRKNRAQAAAEYAIFLAIIAAAIMAVRVYFQRAVQGKVKQVTDQISPQQYNPTDTSSITTTDTEGSGSYNMQAMESTSTGHEETVRDSQEKTLTETVEEP